jgi:hypothetical protein
MTHIMLASITSNTPATANAIVHFSLSLPRSLCLSLSLVLGDEPALCLLRLRPVAEARLHVCEQSIEPFVLVHQLLNLVGRTSSSSSSSSPLYRGRHLDLFQAKQISFALLQREHFFHSQGEMCISLLLVLRGTAARLLVPI